MNNSMRLVVLLLCSFSLSSLTPALRAQTITTGSIERTVIGPNSAVIPGVIVVVTSPNLILPRSATTNPKGSYHLLNLPPGRYVVTVEAANGFARFQQRNVEVNPHFAYGNNEGFAVPRGMAAAHNNAPGGISVGRTRTPTLWNLDVGATYPIQLKETRQLSFQMNWFNVLNSQRAIKQDETLLINSSISGVPPIPNPFYGTGTIFQYPSSLMLGIKLRF